MKISSKLAIAALLIIIIGVVLSLTGYTKSNWGNFFQIISNNHKVEMVSKSEDLSMFTNIDVNVDIDNVEIVKADKYRIELEYDKSLGEITYENANNTLTVEKNKKQFGITIVNSEIQKGSLKIYVPNDAKLQLINLDIDDGNIIMKDLAVDKLLVDNDYGDIDLKGITSSELQIQADDGEIVLTNVNAEKITIDNDYGDVSMSQLMADSVDMDIDNGRVNGDNLTINNKLYIDDDYGNVEFNTLKCNSFEADLENGDLVLNEVVCDDTKIDNEYGNVSLNFTDNEDNYSYSLDDEYGNIYINKANQGGNANKQLGSKKINVNCENGDIDLNFKVN